MDEYEAIQIIIESTEAHTMFVRKFQNIGFNISLKFGFSGIVTFASRIHVFPKRGPWNRKPIIKHAIAETKIENIFIFLLYQIVDASILVSGEGGIRTLGTLRYTVFPGLPFKPLTHLSKCFGSDDSKTARKYPTADGK